MAFILTGERAEDSMAAFRRYREHLKRERHRFPPSAYALATSGWYHDAADHRCPHDAWLESVEIREPACGARREVRSMAMRVRLLGAFHGGHIELHYLPVHGYRLDFFPGAGSHRDRGYDEFTVNRAGRLIHTGEWFGAGETAVWRIEASDVELTWKPLAADR